VREQVIAQIEFDIARNADDHPARQELKNSLDQGDSDDQERVGKEFLTGHTGVQIVDSAAQDLREKYPDSVVK